MSISFKFCNTKKILSSSCIDRLPKIETAYLAEHWEQHLRETAAKEKSELTEENGHLKFQMKVEFGGALSKISKLLLGSELKIKSNVSFCTIGPFAESTATVQSVAIGTWIITTRVRRWTPCDKERIYALISININIIDAPLVVQAFVKSGQLNTYTETEMEKFKLMLVTKERQRRLSLVPKRGLENAQASEVPAKK